jgi:hypothetical protein
MYQLPSDILNIIISYCDIYSIKQLSQINKDFHLNKLIGKKLTKNEENKIELMEENKDGIGIGGNQLNIAHKDNPFYWHRKEYPSPWEFRWKLSYIWWLDITTSINLQPGLYEISGILWNIYETLIGEIRISNDYEYLIINRKFIPRENLVAFPNYRDRFYEINKIDDYEEGKMVEITNYSNSLPIFNNLMIRKYRYEMGIIDIRYLSKVYLSLSNTCCSYHKDNIVFECFRIKKLG